MLEYHQRCIYGSSDAEIDEVKQSFGAFVDLCERKEAESGEPVVIVARY